jgi:hypothetical protein
LGKSKKNIGKRRFLQEINNTIGQVDLFLLPRLSVFFSLLFIEKQSGSQTNKNYKQTILSFSDHSFGKLSRDQTE